MLIYVIAFLLYFVVCLFVGVWCLRYRGGFLGNALWVLFATALIILTVFLSSFNAGLITVAALSFLGTTLYVQLG